MLLLHCHFHFCFPSRGRANANIYSQHIAGVNIYTQYVAQSNLSKEVNVNIIYSLTAYSQCQDSPLAKQQNKLDVFWVFLRGRGCSELRMPAWDGGQSVILRSWWSPNWALLFFCLFHALWFGVFFLIIYFSFSCPRSGKIPSAELHPLSSTTIAPLNQKTSSHGRSGRPGGQDPATPATLHQGCQPKKPCDEALSPWLLSDWNFSNVGLPISDS